MKTMSASTRRQWGARMAARMAAMAGMAVSTGMGLGARGAWAQGSPDGNPGIPGPVRALGVFALLGDTVAISVAGPLVDTRVDRLERRELQVPQIGFDLVALRAAQAVVRAQSAAPRLWMFRAPAPLTLPEQRAVAEGARRAELPAWIVQAINQEKLSHVLLIVRARGQAAFPVQEGFTLGRGQLEGIGYHLDPLQRVANADNAAGSRMLGAHALVELIWLDAMSGALLAARDIGIQRLAAPQPGSDPNDPWGQIEPTARAEILRTLLQEATQRGVQESWPRR